MTDIDFRSSATLETALGENTPACATTYGTKTLHLLFPLYQSACWKTGILEGNSSSLGSVKK